MNASEALARLRRTSVPAVSTADAAALLRQSVFAASKTLGRLAEAGLIMQVRHGLYWLDGEPDPHRLASHLTPPLDAYVSLQSALFLHGMIEQIPQVVYVVSLARSQTIRTSVATFSVHHIAPGLFGGFDETREHVRLASPEKALFDFAYLSSGRSRLFTRLPELELGPSFSRHRLEQWVERTPSERGRTLVRRKLEVILQSASGTDRG